MANVETRHECLMNILPIKLVLVIGLRLCSVCGVVVVCFVVFVAGLFYFSFC